VLDVGCGRGDLLARLPAFGRSGIEISDAGLSLARTRLPDAELAAGDIQRGSPLPGPFDAITAVNVLEHLDHPDAGLAALAAVHRPGGLLVVHLPVVGTASQRWFYAAGYDADPTHVWRPSGPEARRVIEAAGYRHVRSAYAPFIPMGVFRHLPLHPAWLGVFRRR